jgi:ABC-2 type transport system ATP-binding protein
MTPSVHVRGLTKSYGAFQAVKGVDFEIRPGEVFGLLGPNGAGKTTTVEILEGLRPRNRSEVSVLGFDPGRDSRRVKDRIGVCLQATNLPDRITVREAMRLFASFYSRTVDADALLQRLMLWEKRDAAYGTLSGGQQQRLALALALVNDPQLLFLDEPSAGLDPQARLEIHGLVQELRREQRTICSAASASGAQTCSTGPKTRSSREARQPACAAAVCARPIRRATASARRSMSARSL